MQNRLLSKNLFGPGISLVCFAYLILELFFNSYALITVDEFWFAHITLQYQDKLPYRDFSPYKTVLGYYFLLFPLILAKTKAMFASLIFIKDSITLLNTLVLLVTGLWLQRFFSNKAVFFSLLFFIVNEIVICYSTNIRVDLFAYWLVLFSLLNLLDKRFFIAGLLLGLAFATSQKAAWYIFACNLGLGLQWLLLQRNMASAKKIIFFNLTCASVILLYLSIWASFASWHTVINNVFTEGAAMYQLDWYAPTRKLFWATIIINNPFLFLIWPLTFFSLLVTFINDQHFSLRLFLCVVVAGIFICLIPYNQVFPYYMQVTFPIFLLLYAAFFDWLFKIFLVETVFILKPQTKFLLWTFSVVYAALFILLSTQLKLPLAYAIIFGLPFLLTYYLTHKFTAKNEHVNLSRHFFLLICFFLGFVYPLTSLTKSVSYLDGSYQKANLRLLNELLQEGGDYVAGGDLLYTRYQPIPGMIHLMGPTLDYLRQPSAKLRKVMLASLNQDPTSTTQTVIDALQQSQVKFYLNNYRMDALPTVIKDYLATEFTHYWGSIYIYAPRILPGKQTIKIKFSGYYRIDAEKNQLVQINQKTYKTNDHLYLAADSYLSNAPYSFRLVLIPNRQETVFYPEQFSKDHWQRMI